MRSVREARAMRMRISIILAAAMVAATAAPAAHAGIFWGKGCEHEAEREASLPLEGVRTVEVFALAGELRLRGREGADGIAARGHACSSRKDMLEAIGITVRRLDDRVQLLAEMPDISGGTRREWKDEFATMDLEIEVPAGVAVVLHDSSGDIEVEGVAALELSDSSGDIDLREIAGAVTVPRDSSGDIFMRDVGDVTIQVDSSGDIEIRNAASVTIANDTSGDIRLEEIAGDVLVGNDSSGVIEVRGVGGNFVVENDTSGGIRHSGVAGEVSLPDQRFEP